MTPNEFVSRFQDLMIEAIGDGAIRDAVCVIETPNGLWSMGTLDDEGDKLPVKSLRLVAHWQLHVFSESPSHRTVSVHKIRKSRPEGGGREFTL